MGIQLGSFRRDDPNSATEKVHKFYVEHKGFSWVSIGGILSLFFFRLIPLGWLSFLPDWTGKAIVMIVLANLIAFLPSRKLHRHIRSMPVDIIQTANPAARQKRRTGHYYEGKFASEYEFKWGKPLSWTNDAGKRVYGVIEVNEEEEIAYCSYLGDYLPEDLMAFEEAWKKQRMKNDEQRRQGTKLLMKSNQIKSEVRAAVSNAWIRDLDTLEFDESINEAVDNVLPDVIEEQAKVDEDVLEDLEKSASEVADHRLGVKEDEQSEERS